MRRIYYVGAPVLTAAVIATSWWLGAQGLPAPRVEVGNAAVAEAPTRERQQAVNGTLYAVIAPTYNGATSSFIRLFNGGSAASNFSISVVGSPSGRTYGTATISVPVRAAPQFPLSDILSRANAGALTGGDTSYSLYIQNPDATAGYQHVTFNGTNSFFENVSVCSNLLRQSVLSVVNSAVLTNVHTTQLANFPSSVEVHSYWNAPLTYRFTVISAADGTIVGTFDEPFAANETKTMSMATIQQRVNWTPAAGQVHANIVITDTTGAPPAVMVGQAILNNTLAAQVSMSNVCAVNAASSASGGASGGGAGVGDGGGISY